MRKKPTRKRPYFKMESVMTAISRDASGKMHHGILFDPPLGTCKDLLVRNDTLATKQAGSPKANRPHRSPQTTDHHRLQEREDHGGGNTGRASS